MSAVTLTDALKAAHTLACSDASDDMQTVVDFLEHLAAHGTAPAIEVQPGHAFLAPPGTEVRHVDGAKPRQDAVSADTPKLRRLVTEYMHACEMVRGHAVPQWRALVAYLDGKP